MTKLYIQGIRKLPPEFVRDGTQIAQLDTAVLFAVHPMLAPIKYCRGRWKKFVPITIPRPVAVVDFTEANKFPTTGLRLAP